MSWMKWRLSSAARPASATSFCAVAAARASTRKDRALGVTHARAVGALCRGRVPVMEDWARYLASGADSRSGSGAVAVKVRFSIHTSAVSALSSGDTAI